MCVSRLPCGHDRDTAQCSPPQPTPQLSVCNLLAQERRATYEPQPMFNLWGTTMTEIRKEQTCTIRAMTQVPASMCWSSSDSLCEIPSVTATAAFRARMERTNPCECLPRRTHAAPQDVPRKMMVWDRCAALRSQWWAALYTMLHLCPTTAIVHFYFICFF